MAHDKNSIEKLLSDFQGRHSTLQMESFITYSRGYGHAYGNYRQTLRELRTRWGQRKEVTRQLEEMRMDIRKLRRILTVPFLPGRKRREIDLDRKQDHYCATLGDVEDLDREISKFHDLCLKYKAEVGELDEEKRDYLDREFWIHRLRFKAAVELFRDGRPSAGTIETVISLPQDMRERILLPMRENGGQKLVAWLNSGAPMLLGTDDLESTKEIE